MKSIIMYPTYDEKDNIERLVAAILGTNKEIRIVAVDDNFLPCIRKMLGEMTKKD